MDWLRIHGLPGVQVGHLKIWPSLEPAHSRLMHNFKLRAVDGMIEPGVGCKRDSRVPTWQLAGRKH